MAGDLPSASLIENLRFNATVVVPNAVQGIFKRRRRAVAEATRLNVDKHAVGLIDGMRRKHGEGPIWVRLVRDKALLLLATEDIRRALEGAPEPFAADPPAKRDGMIHFQPDALTISRGSAWFDRRRFTEAVMEDANHFGERLVEIAREEVEELLSHVEADETLEWEPFHRTLRRTTRGVVLGESARDDEGLSDLLGELMSEANKMPGNPSERLGELDEWIGRYVDAPEEGSLVSLFAEAPVDEQTKPVGQVPHWLFAMQDTLAINAFRALALIASHPVQRSQLDEELAEIGRDGPDAGEVARLDYLEACLEEAMRLWPTTTMLSREAVEDTEWNGERVPAGTQLVISNVFNHRDRERHDYADRFAPEEWTEGDAAEDWSFNHFSHGPQGCPGAGLALFIGKAVLASLLVRRTFRLEQPKLDPGKSLPHMLDYFSIRVGIGPRA